MSWDDNPIAQSKDLDASHASVNVCSICHDHIENYASTKLTCGHRYHTECITQWSEVQVQKTCPDCRCHFVLPSPDWETPLKEPKFCTTNFWKALIASVHLPDLGTKNSHCDNSHAGGPPLPSAATSWDSYIDDLIARSKDASGSTHVDKACIIGIDGGAKWTTDGHANAYKLSATEAANIAQCFKSKDFTAFMGAGIHAESTKYLFLREEDGKVVYGKKKGFGAITCQASKTAIVIAHMPEGRQQGNTNKGVGAIADYLESMNM